MDTNRLKHFCAVAELESLSKAAELLGITHSGLHKSIKVLESDLGYALTRPKGRGIGLTEKAKVFYPKAIEIIELVEKSLNPENHVESELIKLGGIEVFMPFLASHLAGDELLSNVNVELHEFGAGVLEAAVKDKVLDYGVTYIPVSTSGLQFLKISSFQMGIFYKNKSFKNLDLSEVPFVVPFAPLVNNPSDIKNRDGWASSKIQRNIKYKTNSLFTALELVAAGQAAVYIPEFVSDHFTGGIHQLEIKDKSLKQKRDVYLILRNESEEDKFAKKISKIIRKWLK